MATFLRTIMCATLVERGTCTFTALIEHAIVLGNGLFILILPAHLSLVGLVLALLYVMKVVQIGVLVVLWHFCLAVGYYLIGCTYQSFGTSIMRLYQNVLRISSVRSISLMCSMVKLGRMVGKLFLRQVLAAIPRLLHIDRTST